MAAPTVRTRLSAFFSEDRIAGHFERKVLLVLDGDVVTDLDQPAPDGTRLVIGRS